MAEPKGMLKRAYAFDANTSTATTRELYEDWAAVYDGELEHAQGYAMPQRCADALARFAAPIETRVLDVGCGTGLSGAALRSVGVERMVGCDLSPKMLSVAERRGLYERTFVADVTQPPLDVAAASFDAVTAVGVFAFGHLPVETLDTLLDYARPGGLVVVGANDHFLADGAFDERVASLAARGEAERLAAEHGEHLPASDVRGWVYVLRRKRRTATAMPT